jgi:hypothetical protein
MTQIALLEKRGRAVQRMLGWRSASGQPPIGSGADLTERPGGDECTASLGPLGRTEALPAGRALISGNASTA